MISRRTTRAAAGALALTLSGSALAAVGPQSQTTASAGAATTAAAPVDPRLEGYKRETDATVDRLKDFTQQMVDQVFSFAEPGFQEFESAKYLTAILEKHGFRVERNYAGIPTAWVATWGSGKPVIAIGSDLDCVPASSQKPGVAYHEPLIEGAPGHGEGHNSGLPLSITAAIAVKEIMARDRISGTLKIWPGIAEEMVGAKAYYVRAGLFRDVDISLYSHVSQNFGTGWGSGTGTGLQGVRYTFTGESAHSASQPWRGRSALDAVELMDIAWNFQREHLRLQQRSHYVIVDGGAQPNVVPSTATVWYYLRETDYEHIKALRGVADRIAGGAAQMTGTTVSSRLTGSAWLAHMNRTVAETMYANIEAVGLPVWDEADQTLAKGLQTELKQPAIGLPTKIQPLRGDIPPDQNYGGGSDDIGDISWNVPTATLAYPANIPNLPGHHWANAVAMATPIAHKGTTAGAKVQARTILDFLLRPELIEQAWTYFREVQTRDRKYQPLIAPEDTPAIDINGELLTRLRPAMRKFYYDPTKYKTYLDQLGVKYPTVRLPAAEPSPAGGR
jgi:aminobenzoyl-glutamate utilization protein B